MYFSCTLHFRIMVVDYYHDVHCFFIHTLIVEMLSRDKWFRQIYWTFKQPVALTSSSASPSVEIFLRSFTFACKLTLARNEKFRNVCLQKLHIFTLLRKHFYTLNETQDSTSWPDEKIIHEKFLKIISEHFSKPDLANLLQTIWQDTV